MNELMRQYRERFGHAPSGRGATETRPSWQGIAEAAATALKSGRPVPGWKRLDQKL
jgi:hypothetical protein